MKKPMRLIAEFIMRGRAQAALVALLGNLVPLVSPATVGLVTLRRSIPEGVLVLLWACLPSFIALYASDINQLIIGMSVVTVAGVLLAAETLKISVSWSRALPVILACSALGTLLLSGIFAAHSQQLTDEVQQVMLSLQQQEVKATGTVFHLLMAVTAQNLAVEQVSLTFVLGFLSWLTGAQILSCLLLARWWQALLYNPGGFREEFHSLRLEQPLAIGLLLGIAACYLGSGDYAHWASLLGMPLLIAALGLGHFVAASLKLARFWLVLLYLGLVFLSPLSLVLVGIGFLDSMMNFRARLTAWRGP